MLDNSNGASWQLLAQCYAALGEKGQAALASAEAALLQSKPEEALLHIQSALKDLPDASPARLRAEDLQAEASRLNKKLTDDR